MPSSYLSVIVINYGVRGLLSNFLKSMTYYADFNLVRELVIVDNGYPLQGDSRDRVDASLFPFKIKFVQNSENSYASGVNRGVAVASEEILVIANNDIEWLPTSSINSLVDCLERDPRIGVVGPQLIYPDGSWQRSYGRLPSVKEAMMSLTMLDSMWHGIVRLVFGHNWLPTRPKRVGYIDGAFMVVRRSCFEELGGFNEEYSFYGEDADFCWRAWKNGWKVVFVPDARVMHLRGASSTADALGDYTIRLIKAKQKFVQDHFGIHQAKWYRRLIKIALLERFILYNFVAKLIHSPRWQRRAFEARVRYHAMKKRYNNCKGCYG